MPNKKPIDRPDYEQIASELTKPALIHYPTRQVKTKGIHDTWGVDLVDMGKLSEENNDIKFLLCVIDCFSRFAWVIPLKNKTDKEVLNALKKVVQANNKIYPSKIWSDDGKEFNNTLINRWYKDNDIERYSTYGNSKSAIVERFNKSLKSIMWKYLLGHRTYKYIDVLPELVEFYNKRHHRSIKTTPAKAHNLNSDGEQKLWALQYGEVKTNKDKPKFSVNDVVRLSLNKQTFSKGYTGSWTQNLYRITEQLNTVPYTYKVQTLDGENVKGSLYEQEMLKSESTTNDNWLVGKNYKIVGSLGTGQDFLLKTVYQGVETFEPVEAFIKNGAIDKTAYDYIKKHKLEKKSGI